MFLEDTQKNQLLKMNSTQDLGKDRASWALVLSYRLENLGSEGAQEIILMKTKEHGLANW